MSIGHPIPELWLFQNLTLKIKGQGQGRIQDSKLGVAQMDWKIWKPGGAGGGSHISQIYYDYHNISFNYDTFQNFKYYDFFITTILYILSPLYYIVLKKSYLKFFRGGARPVRPPLNPPLKVMSEVTAQSHNVGLNILSIHIPFVPCQSALPFLRYSIFKIWPWKSKVKAKWPWCCTTKGQDNSIELRMV